VYVVAQPEWLWPSTRLAGLGRQLATMLAITASNISEVMIVKYLM